MMLLRLRSSSMSQVLARQEKQLSPTHSAICDQYQERTSNTTVMQASILGRMDIEPSIRSSVALYTSAVVSLHQRLSCHATRLLVITTIHLTIPAWLSLLCLFG